MRIALFPAFALFSLLFFLACAEDPVKQIPALEAHFAATNSTGAADSLLQAYQAAVKAHPDKHAENLHYLSKAAEIKFLRNKDAVTAVRWLNDGLKMYGAGQNLTEPVGMLARVWYAYQYKATPDLSKNPDDIDLMRANLEQNLPWLDSSLARLDKVMGGAATNGNIKSAAEPFLQISEAYATLVQNTDPDKQAGLLMRAAGLAKTIGDPNKALRLYYNVAEKMPNHPKAPTALFMMAFIYENDLKDLDKAKSTYEDFLKKYPNDPDYTDDVQSALKFLGMPPEEIIRQFEQHPQ